MAADEGGVDVEEGFADILCEGEVGFPVAAVVVVIKDAAGAARFFAVGQVEIFVAPFFEFRIVARVVTVAGGFHGGVEVARVGVVVAALDVEDGGEVAAAAEP